MRLPKVLRDIVTELIAQIAEKDSTIAHLTAKDCIYRFYRDIRFSPDKSPYKRHFGAFIAHKADIKASSAATICTCNQAESMLVTGTYILDKNQLHHYAICCMVALVSSKTSLDKPDQKTSGDVTSCSSWKRCQSAIPH